MRHRLNMLADCSLRGSKDVKIVLLSVEESIPLTLRKGLPGLQLERESSSDPNLRHSSALWRELATSNCMVMSGMHG